MSTEFKLEGFTCSVEAITDPGYSPSVDFLAIRFGPVRLGLFSAAERKAFIAALQAADAELDVAALRSKKEQAAA